jgi:hypothetical protein
MRSVSGLDNLLATSKANNDSVFAMVYHLARVLLLLSPHTLCVARKGNNKILLRSST